MVNHQKIQIKKQRLLTAIASRNSKKSIFSKDLYKALLGANIPQ